MNEFFSLERNYIILTNSGKPVFSAYGDMYVLSSVYATLYAMISKVQTFEFKHIDLEVDGRNANRDTLEQQKYYASKEPSGDKHQFPSKVITQAEQGEKKNIIEKLFVKEKENKVDLIGEDSGFTFDDDEGEEMKEGGSDEESKGEEEKPILNPYIQEKKEEEKPP